MSACLPITADNCYEELLRCLRLPEIEELNALLGRLLSELEGPIRDMLEVVAALLQKIAELLLQTLAKLAEIAQLDKLLGLLSSCLGQAAVRCESGENLVGMLLLRRNELFFQTGELGGYTDPVFGAPAQLAKYQGVLSEMICFQANSLITQAVIDEIKKPPDVTEPQICPRPV